MPDKVRMEEISHSQEFAARSALNEMSNDDNSSSWEPKKIEPSTDQKPQQESRQRTQQQIDPWSFATPAIHPCGFH
jgi:hypothetical protein